MSSKLKVSFFCVISVVILVLSIILSFSNNKVEPPSDKEKRIIRLWHIDSFEGGTGSRANFLSSIALDFEKKVKNTLIMVTAHTQESATNLLEQGNTPDLISFGAGFDLIARSALDLSQSKFNSTKNNGFAVAWCRGGYAFFSMGESEFDSISSENTVVSNSGNELGLVGISLMGLKGDFDVLPSTSAYVKLINDKYRYMLGTQRDIYRLISRGVSYSVKPIQEFSDLYQYLSVTTQDEKNVSVCLDFLSYMLTDSVQKELAKIGMLSVNQSIYENENEKMHLFESIEVKYTINAFCSSQSKQEIKQLALSSLSGDENSLKYLVKVLV